MIVRRRASSYIEFMIHRCPMGRGPAAARRPSRFPALLAAAVVGACLWASGCGGGGTSPPGDEPPVISFAPPEQGVLLTLGQSRDFSATVVPDVDLAVTWRKGGTVVGVGRSFGYEASHVGRDTLRVHAEAGAVVRDFFWVVEVVPEPDTAPPPVPVVTSVPGAEPAQVVLSWTRVSGSTYPIVDYAVVVSYAGLVTAQNWDQAQALGTVAHLPGQIAYTLTFDRANGGLIPGAEAWFAVRARDDRGQMSAAVTNRYTRITTEWWIDGRVINDAGQPLLGVVVGTTVPLRNSNTDGSGHFRLGPYRSIDSVSVRTTTDDYYDYTTARLGSAADADLDLVLPGKYGVDPACTAYDGDFLNYLRHMTRTVASDVDTSASRLWKWDHWPITVFLPDSTTAGGRELDDLARAMLARWNTALGETYLTEATTAAAADVRFAWVIDAAAGYGETALVLPAGRVLGDVVPQKIRVEIEIGLGTDQFFQEVALHELGHVLGLVNHSIFCTGSGHLMVLGASGNLSLPNPIHPDEVRAVRCVRRLPQGADMRRYVP